MGPNIYKEHRLLYWLHPQPRRKPQREQPSDAADVEHWSDEEIQKKYEKLRERRNEHRSAEESARRTELIPDPATGTVDFRGFARLPEKEARAELARYTADERAQMLLAMLKGSEFPQHISIELEQLDMIRSIMENALQETVQPKTWGMWLKKVGTKITPAMWHGSQ